MEHDLKTDSKVFQAMRKGFKNFEIRLNDRNFKENDILLLRETFYNGEEMKAGMPLLYTGAMLSVEVVYILHGPIYGLKENWVIMSNRLLP